MNTDMNQLGKDLANIIDMKKVTACQLRALLCWASSLTITVLTEHISSY